jgi:hypothetical protein
MPLRSYMFFLILLLPTLLLSQVYWPLASWNSFVALNAQKKNVQWANPAAFSIDDKKGCSIETVLPLSIPNLLGIRVKNHFAKANISYHQDLSLLLCESFIQGGFSNAIALAINQNFKMGLALQTKFLQQPQYYGNFFTALGRLGLQYQMNKAHYLSMVLDDIAPKQMQIIRIEHLWCMQQNLHFAQGLQWCPSSSPQIYLSIQQSIKDYHLQFGLGIPMQSFEVAVSHKLKSSWEWTIMPTWRQGIGYLVQFQLSR